MSPVSSGSTLHGWFPNHSLIRVSQTALLAVVHCKLTDWLVCKNLQDADKRWCAVDSLGPFEPATPPPPPRSVGESIAIGQVPMATDHGRRRRATLFFKCIPKSASRHWCLLAHDPHAPTRGAKPAAPQAWKTPKSRNSAQEKATKRDGTGDERPRTPAVGSVVSGLSVLAMEECIAGNSWKVG